MLKCTHDIIKSEIHTNNFVTKTLYIHTNFMKIK